MATKKNIGDEVNNQPEVNLVTETMQNQNIENIVPTRQFRNFDEFFADYIKNKSINKNWKEPVIIHAKAINCFEDPTKWIYACQHFGI